jgi:hypothetical protein
MIADALYAYAVLPEDARLPETAPPILPGARLVLVAGGGCAALASPVHGADFEPAPRGRLGDAGWVAERERAHRATIAAAAAGGPVLPLAFGAIFSGAGRLAAWLDACGPRLRTALSSHRAEAGVAQVLAQGLALRLEREAQEMPRSLTGLADDASLDELRAEIARIGRRLGNADLARRIAGSV